MISNLNFPYEVAVGELFTITWTSYSNYCDVYRIVNYGPEEYITSLYSYGNYWYDDYVEMGWTSVQYRIVSQNYPWNPVQTGVIWVFQNEPPSTPGSILAPTSVTVGQSYTLSWSPSYDPEGDFVFYTLERSINGNAYAYYNYTSGTSTTDTALGAWSTVRYRIFSQDTFNNWNGNFSYSPTITVVPAQPLITPTYINVPSNLMYGENLPVDWDTTSNGEDVLYNLELSFNDEPFKTVPTSTSVKIIPSWCTKVIVRVRAINNIGTTSDYVTSSPVNIVHSNIFTKVGGDIKR